MTPLKYPRAITCNLSLGTAFIQIKNEYAGEPLQMMSDKPLSVQEASAVHCIMQSLNALSSGKNVEAYFNPIPRDVMEMEESRKVVVRCRWRRSGTLLIGTTPTTKKYLHATTVSEALSRKRAFTCTLLIANQLPVTRSAFYKEE